MKEKSTICLVDDERNILTSLSIALEAEGYKVRAYTDGAAALDALTEEPADLAVLDIKMPRMDGMELLRRLRMQTDMPVIFLTSKDEEIDELFGLKMGADDYIAKPFSQRLVVERVKAVLRRFQPKDPTQAMAEQARVMERGKLRLDPERNTCHWICPPTRPHVFLNQERQKCTCDGKPVRLTTREFKIVSALASHPGAVKTRVALLSAAYKETKNVSPRVIDKAITRIRKKFKPFAGKTSIIQTRRGTGYQIPPERLRSGGWCPIALTITEFLILQALATRPGVVRTRDALMDAAYDDQVYVDDRTIDSHIKRLRKKFKVVDDDFDLIETLYGVGYRFKEA